MKKQIRKILACGLLASAMAVTTLCPSMTAYAAETSAAEWQQSATYKGTNLNAQDYSKWSQPVRSYLVSCDENRLMRVQYAESMDGILIEYYGKSYQFEASKVIPQELPVFGGFYESDQYYFILTGQKNLNKSSTAEVYRITKYDKDWNRMGSAGLSNCNTKNPFDASSARMDAYKNYLLIRTGRTMYDGHQSNITFQLDMNAMKITDFYAEASNITAGYVSHSFNQFIKVEDGCIIAVDHGDAYPRSIVLTKYNSDLSSGRFSGRCSSADILKFAGTVMNGNSTGGSAGGFEISGSSYLVAGNSVVQDSRSLSRKTRNVFVAAADKNNINQVTVNWLTDYSEGEATASTPHMVKTGGDSYAVLWSRNGAVYYTAVDGQGKQTGRIYEMQGKLSDCVPVVSNGKLVWYTWENENIVFYEIDIRNLSETKSKAIRNGKKPDSGTENKQEDTTGSGTAATPGTTPPAGSSTQVTPGTSPSWGNKNENKADTSKKEYTVTFHANGGSMGGYRFMDIQTTGQKLSHFPNPYRNGYTFEGWYTKADGGTKASLSTKYDADQTLYAHWKDNGIKESNTEKKEYKITFNPEGGTVTGSPDRYTAGNRLEDLPKASKDGYEFICWRTWEGKIVTTSNTFLQDTEVYAQWRKLKTSPENSGSKTRNEYTVTFHANGGIIDGPSSITTVNQKLPSIPTASREGYTFIGWYNLDLSRIPADTSWTFYMDFDLYAYWLPDNSSAADPVKTGTDSKTITMPDTVENASPVTGSDAKTGTGSGAKTDTDKKIGIGINIKPDSGTDTKTSTGQNTKTDTGTGSKTDIGTDKIPDSRTGTKTGTETDAEPDSGTGIKTGTDTKPYTDVNTDTGADTKPDSGTGSTPGTGLNLKPDDEGTAGQDISADTSVKKAKLKSAKSPAAGKLKVKWKLSGASSGFQISCSRRRSFPVKKTVLKKTKAANRSITISRLSKGKNYYVKVRAYKKVNGRIYYGKWSNVRKVKIRK